MKHLLKLLLPLIVVSGCTVPESNEFSAHLDGVPSIKGKQEYLTSPYVSAGDRVYMVGHQDGSFPEIGWHITGEMGGIWNHPIKLMDGFDIEIALEEGSFKLNNAHTFTNYPFANRHDFKIEEPQIEIERWQFVPDNKEGVVIQLIINNQSGTDQELKVHFSGHADLRPTWLGERTQMIDHQDVASWNQELDSWMVKDSMNEWYVVYGSDVNSTDQGLTHSEYSGKGVSNTSSYDFTLKGNTSQVIHFIVVGSYTSQDDATGNYVNIKDHILSDFNAKKDRYMNLAERSKLTIPDKEIEKTFEWLKYNSDWLIRTVPEIGSGIAAGIPDYPWWFGVDSEYALKGYMAIGREDVVNSTISLLDSISNATNGNGRIVHEVSTNGAVFNPGNINETPQYASLIWEIYQWNGDREFLEKYYPTIQKGLDWLMQENDKDGNLFPDGFGMMEIHGLDSEMIDVASYSQRAFQDASKIATQLDDQESASRYQKLADQLETKINEEFWSEEFGSYADFIGTDEQALELITDAIIRADTLNKPWAVEELKSTRDFILANPSHESRPFVLHHNWVVNTPMEMGIADEDKAIVALQTAEKFVNPFGVFVTGIDRDESAGSDDGSFKGSKIFSYTGAVMTLPTGVQVVAENNYGRPDKALNYIKRMTRTFSYALPGSMYEVSPDYGMIAQAWNIYSYAVPIVQQFFGIQPQAYNKRIVITPQMPVEWNEASLENIAVADNEIDVYYSKTNDKLNFRIEQDNPEWEIFVKLPAEENGKANKVGKSPVEPISENEALIFSAKGAVINIELVVEKGN
ncbi:MAG: glycogen debranching protein [Saprospiraceae bacterium]|nr:glycogen debranching protein [Saprospiraceae bacterium]